MRILSWTVCYLADGQLHVSGRKNDPIIVRGENIYANDLEAIANEVPGVRPGRAVAFGVPDPRLGTKAVVIVCSGSWRERWSRPWGKPRRLSAMAGTITGWRLAEDWERLVIFYAFSKEHWKRLRTMNVAESPFGADRPLAETERGGFCLGQKS